MRDILLVIFSVVVAQALGVALAWGTNRISHRWRSREKLVTAVNAAGSFFILIGLLRNLSFFQLFVALLVAFLVLVWCAHVQAKQYRVSFKAAFQGAFFQLMVFYFSLTAVDWAFNQFFLYRMGFGVLVFSGSAWISHFLFSFFKPTIDAATSGLRAKFREVSSHPVK